MAAGQDWCLECGTAVNIHVRSAPNWRIPVAIVVGVVALVVVVLVLTLNAASDSANQSVPAVLATAPPAVHHHATAKPAAGPPAATGPTVGSWPAGVSGFTVVLAVIHDKAGATSEAKKIALTGVPVGLLFSSDYSSMRPGDWIVFSGTYTSRGGAETAATALKGRGQPGAYAFSVVPAAGATTTPAGAATTPGATTTSP